MAGSMRVAFAAAEAVPFAKAGGLGDIAGALPASLGRLGHEVSLFLPLYASVDRERWTLNSVLSAELPSFARAATDSFRLLELAGSEYPRVYFIDAPAYFDRPGLYTDPRTGKGYTDDGERFLFFSLAILESLHRLGEAVDLVHCNDFHTGMLPFLLNRHYRRQPALRHAVTVYSIHNLAYQGTFSRDLLKLAGIPSAEFRPGSPLEFWGRLNFMKVGIETAEMISTVSPTYAREIASDHEFGCGLEGVLTERVEDLVGILNGIDTELWSPESDRLIERNYDADDADAGKEANKIFLLREAGLDYRADLPLFGIVSRLVGQKGFDLFPPIMEKLLSLPLQLVILGSGLREIEEFFRNCALSHPERLALFLKFDDRLAHQIEAGADFFLMPSRYEPCGLNQMYSLNYGTIPIVRFTGGLADTVREVDRSRKTGNGLGFEEYSPEALLDAISRAIGLYRDKKSFHELRRRAMSQDFSWEVSARAYESLYRAAILRSRGKDEELRPIMRSLRALPRQ